MLDANTYSAGMVAGAAGVDDYYSEYLDYKRAFEEMKQDRDKWVAFNEQLQKDYDELYRLAKTFDGLVKEKIPQHPLADLQNQLKILHGEKSPEEFGVKI